MKLKIQNLLSNLPALSGQVLNRQPKSPPAWGRLAIIGDCPQDFNTRATFTGSTYGMLNQLAGLSGFNLEDCFWGNVLGKYPPVGKTSDAGASDIASGAAQLTQDLKAFAPTLILILDRYAGEFFKPSLSDLDDERGSPFLWNGIPCIITLAPKSIFKRYEYFTVVLEDFKKARRLAQSGWRERPCAISFQPTFQEAVETLQRFIEKRPYLSVDVESKGGDYEHTSCIGFAWSPSDALVIPFDKSNNQPLWSITEERIIWRLISETLKLCPLVGQNCLHYDRKHLLKYPKIFSNFVDDTLFAAWECYPELPKSLAFLNSLYTDNAYHKNILHQARSGKIPYTEEYRYCGLDCCYTYEIIQKLAVEIRNRPAGVYSHYKFNVKVSHVFDYMAQVGCHFDWAKRDQRLKDLDKQALEQEAEVQTLVGKPINCRSPKQVNTYLYETLKLPKRYKIVFNKKTEEEEEKVTGDYLTILYLARNFPAQRAVLKIGLLRKLYKRISSLKKIKGRPNGTIGWEFTVPGTVTGRTSGKKPLDKLGIQPQNLDRDDRDLCIAGEGFELLKADLEGADSWTVAVMLKSLGHSSLWDDLLRGLKPAQVIAIAVLLKNDDLISAPCEQLLNLRHLLKTPEGKIVYRYSKNVGHGSAYAMRGQKGHETIFKESDGEIFIPKAEFERLQKLLYRRYPFPDWHNFMRSRLVKDGYLDSASGTRRYFLGRKDDSTLRDMLAHAPQAHTTYAANVVLDRISSDPENRREGKLLLQPINQVHDETLLRYPVADRETCHSIFKRHCRVEMDYWGTKFVIPFEAKYGADWGTCINDIQL